MLVNESFVRGHLEGLHPIGTTLRTLAEAGFPETTYEIIGVVGDTKYADLPGSANRGWSQNPGADRPFFRRVGGACLRLVAGQPSPVPAPGAGPVPHLYAQRIDPAQGTPSGEPFLVQHLHDPRRRWGSTPYGNAIVSNAFVFNQTETTASIWLLDSSPSR